MHPLVRHIENELASVMPPSEAADVALWLAEELSGFSRTMLIMGKDSEKFSVEKIDVDYPRLPDALRRLKQGEPLAYILGYVDWCGLRLKVTPSTLIPRPETAELVDMVLDDTPNQPMSVADLCTGSGCIALALKHQRQAWDIVGTDLSEQAVLTARQNMLDNHLTVSFRKADVLKESGQYDIVVSNPPYIPLSELSTVDESVLRYEPRSALFVSDNDPLLFYRTILENYKAKAYFFETYPPLLPLFYPMAEKHGLKISVKTDFAGKQRFVRLSADTDFRV